MVRIRLGRAPAVLLTVFPAWASPTFIAMAVALRQELGSSITPKLTFARACDMSKGLPGLGKKADAPCTRDKPIGLTGIMDVPMYQALGARTKQTRHLFDIIDDVPDVYDWRAITEAMAQGHYDQLPAPFSPAAGLGTSYIVQFIIAPNVMPEELDEEAAEKLQLTKHFIFDEPIKLDSAMKLVRGAAWLPNFGSNMRGDPRGAQLMLDHIGGRQIRYYMSEEKGDQNATLESIDQAYDFIIEYAPRSEDSSLRQTRWVKKQMQTSNSPIVLGKVQEADVWRAMAKIREQEVQAAPTVGFPLFLADVQDWYTTNILSRLAFSLMSNSVLMLGVSGVGKTPVLEIIMSMVSRYHKRTMKEEDWACAEFREASCFDFFRLEKGRRNRPDSLDDSDLNEQPIAKLKSCFDMRVLQAQTKERWGAAAWEHGQLRVAADNKFAPSLEPTGQEATIHASFHPRDGAMPYETFINMIRPAFIKDASNADLEAIVKRCTVVVHCKTHVYLRLAGREGASKVERYAMESDILIKQTAIDVLKEWSDARKANPAASVHPLRARPSDAIEELANKDFQWLAEKMDTRVPEPEGSGDEGEVMTLLRTHRTSTSVGMVSSER